MKAFNFFNRSKGFTAVKCVFTQTESGLTYGDDIKASFGSFEDALIFSKATTRQYRDSTSRIVHVDVYCNKSGDKVYHTMS